MGWKHCAAAAAAILTFTGAAQATLFDRGGGMIYDTTRNITWLADMNYAKTSGYDNNGEMTWNAANQWADNLVYGGFSDWRLPTLNPSDTSCSSSVNPGGGFVQQYIGYNCTGGELSGLFATDLGNKASQTVLSQSGDTAEQIANMALFSNVQQGTYWSGTEYAPNPSYAWYYITTYGFQRNTGKSVSLYAVAVRPGDVVSAVPEPQTYAMLLLGLGAVVVATRRRAH